MKHMILSILYIFLMISISCSQAKNASSSFSSGSVSSNDLKVDDTGEINEADDVGELKEEKVDEYIGEEEDVPEENKSDSEVMTEEDEQILPEEDVKIEELPNDEQELEVVAEQEQVIPENVDQEDVVEEIPVGNFALSCNEATADPALDNVVEISNQGGGDIKFDNLTIVILKLSGQANVFLGSDEVAKIKGLCIHASGDAQAKIDVNFSVEELSYSGRGNAYSHIDFKQNGTFNKINLDLAGLHELKVSGSAIDCDKIDKSLAGNGKLACEKI